MINCFTVTFVAPSRPWFVEVPNDPDPELFGLIDTASNDSLAAGFCEKTRNAAAAKATTAAVSRIMCFFMVRLLWNECPFSADFRKRDDFSDFTIANGGAKQR